MSSYEAESTVQAKFFHSTEHRTDDSVNYKALRNMAKDCKQCTRIFHLKWMPSSDLTCRFCKGGYNSVLCTCVRNDSSFNYITYMDNEI